VSAHLQQLSCLRQALAAIYGSGPVGCSKALGTSLPCRSCAVARWAWCREPPYSVDCYFRQWTPCRGYLRSLKLTVEDMRNMTRWDQYDK
jgi:hypothetical protein